MRIGDVIRLGARDYHLLEILGIGYLAQVYKAETLPDQQVVVIKFLKEEHLTDYKARSQFEKECDVLKRLNAAEEAAGTHYAVRLLDAGVDPHGRPYQVQELAQGKPLNLWLRNLPEAVGLDIAIQFAHLLQIAHSIDVALPDMKIDEIFWDGVSIRMVDWNLTRQGIEEQQKDLIRFGALMFHLFAERPLQLTSDLQVKGEIGYGVPKWAQLSEGTRSIIMRAIHREPQKRYHSAEELRQDLEWQRENLRLAQDGRWRDLEARAKEACRMDRWEMALATCLAALEAGPDEDGRLRLERLRDEIQEELGKEIRRPLVIGQIVLKGGEYRRAIEEFEKVLRLDPTNREARYLLAQAHIELALEETDYFRLDPRGREQKGQIRQYLNQVTQALIHKHYKAAEEALELIKKLPAPAGTLLANLGGVQQLEGAIRAGKLVVEAEEALKARNFTDAEEFLQRALAAAPEEEPWIRPLLQQVEAERLRQAELDRLWAQAKQALESGDEDRAITLCEDVLRLDPVHSAAQELVASLRREKRARQLLADAERLSKKGDELGQAEKLVREVLEIVPAQTQLAAEAMALLEKISRWHEVEVRRQRLLSESARLLVEGKYSEAAKTWEKAWNLYQEGELPLSLGNREVMETLHAQIQDAKQRADRQALEMAKKLARDARFQEAIDTLKGIIEPAAGVAQEAEQWIKYAELGLKQSEAAQEDWQQAERAPDEPTRARLIKDALEKLLNVEEFKGPLTFVDQALVDRAKKLQLLLCDLLSIHKGLEEIKQKIEEARQNRCEPAKELLIELQEKAAYLKEMEQTALGDPRWPGLLEGAAFLGNWRRQLQDKVKELIDSWHKAKGTDEPTLRRSYEEVKNKAQDGEALAFRDKDYERAVSVLGDVQEKLTDLERLLKERPDLESLAQQVQVMQEKVTSLLDSAKKAVPIKRYAKGQKPENLIKETVDEVQQLPPEEPGKTRGFLAFLARPEAKAEPSAEPVKPLPKLEVRLDLEKLREVKEQAREAAHSFPDDKDFQNLSKELTSVAELYRRTEEMLQQQDWQSGDLGQIQEQLRFALDPEKFPEPSICWLKDIWFKSLTFLQRVQRRVQVLLHAEAGEWDQVSKVLDEIQLYEKLDVSLLRERLLQLKGLSEICRDLKCWQENPDEADRQKVNKYRMRVKAFTFSPLEDWPRLTKLKDRLIEESYGILKYLDDYFQRREHLEDLWKKALENTLAAKWETILAMKGEVDSIRKETRWLSERGRCFEELFAHIEAIAQKTTGLERDEALCSLGEWLNQQKFSFSQKSRLYREIEDAQARLKQFQNRAKMEEEARHRAAALQYSIEVVRRLYDFYRSD
jgi:uncharacterized protein (DUF1330 family)